MDLRKKKHAHRLNFYLVLACKVLLVSAVLVSAILTFNNISLNRFFPITTIRVYGLQHIGHAEIETLLTPLVRQGFFSTNIDSIRDQLLQMPWVNDISVQRHWPDCLDITFIEKKPIASWKDDTLLSETGELFSPQRDSYPPALPQLWGPDGQQIVMLNYFKDFNRLLSPLHAKIARLELTSYQTWKITLDNGIVLQIGHKDILTRLDHFVKVYPKIVGERAKDVEYIDLRYSNGMAVRWKVPLRA
jgi:cell division protein FtsQ